MRSRQSVLSNAGERSVGVPDRGRIDPGTRRERKEETLIAQHMLEHSGKKAALTRGATNLLNRKPACLKEIGEPLRLLADKAKRLNRQHFPGLFLHS
jgi:hypothetical protein